MSLADRHSSNRRPGAPRPDDRLRSRSATPRLAVAIVVIVGAGIGWFWLAASVAAMLAGTDMATLGPGMAVFNHFNGLADLPAEVRAGLVLLCTPGAIGRWGAAELSAVLLMWEMMTLAMMLPSAAPMLRKVAGGLGPAGTMTAIGRVAAVASGYLLAWTGFSIVATLLQWGLTSASALSSAMGPMSGVLAATTLMAAGLYQFTPMKRACLMRCRVPAPAIFDATPCFLDLVHRGWREGGNCLGCCWALMLLMFAAGVMNILWIAILGAIMALEKLASGEWPSRVIGIALIAVGLVLIVLSPTGARLAQSVLHA
ncbi:MAG: DUF2182 domain-containing protein [Ancalomicrobiaceae bacterium]|nr:DUF2182 domain-containing protein [Ancalomicrobiaceae bacterium]